MSQSEFARRAGLDKQTINNYLDPNKSTEPNQSTLLKIFKAHKNFESFFLDDGGFNNSRNIAMVNDEEAGYGNDRLAESISVLKEEIRDLYSKLKQKETILRILENTGDHRETHS